MRFLVFLFATFAASSADLHITHEFANRNARSVIGVPAGSHKTIVDMDGNLRWSQWSLKHRPPDSPFGFSSQMDGALDIHTVRVEADKETPLENAGQTLFEGRYPFIVTRLRAGDAEVQELAFPAESGMWGMDVVRIHCTNRGAQDVTFETQLSGRRRNLPGHASENTLVTREGYEIVSAQSGGAIFRARSGGLVLAARWTVAAQSSQTLWLKLPYDLPASSDGWVRAAVGETLFQGALRTWQTIFAKAPQFHLPSHELEDFFYSSFANLLILTEYDAAGDLWILDGPTGYRQFWGRGEYFQARALNVMGRSDLARLSLEHAMKLQMDDGEWDGPPISGWPSWDNIGGNSAGVWDYYLFTGDPLWIARAYPKLLNAARWIQLHREESDLESGDVPAGAKPVRRPIPWSCRTETSPPLQPGEKPYFSGLLPWSYGDSGLPEGHSFPHNFFALYAVEVARLAALATKHEDDAAILQRTHANYRDAIQASIQRALGLEKEGAPYLPAMPTYPEAAYSQSFIAVYPTNLYPASDPLVSGLLTRMEREEVHGLPTNQAWLGLSGVWPGEAMNIAETYLRRGDVTKAADMLVAALNHSYSTNVWREEIRVDKSRPRACPNSDSNNDLENGMGTGDMPEAWGNANLVNLLRDMLVLEEGGALHLFAGVPANWFAVGQEMSLRHAPTTFGSAVTVRLTYPAAGKMLLELEPPKTPVDVIARFPIPEGAAITSVRVNGQPGSPAIRGTVHFEKLRAPVRVEVEFR